MLHYLTSLRPAHSPAHPQRLHLHPASSYAASSADASLSLHLSGGPCPHSTTFYSLSEALLLFTLLLTCQITVWHHPPSALWQRPGLADWGCCQTAWSGGCWVSTMFPLAAPSPEHPWSRHLWVLSNANTEVSGSYSCLAPLKSQTHLFKCPNMDLRAKFQALQFEIF